MSFMVFVTARHGKPLNTTLHYLGTDSLPAPRHVLDKSMASRFRPCAGTLIWTGWSARWPVQVLLRWSSWLTPVTPQVHPLSSAVLAIKAVTHVPCVHVYHIHACIEACL